MALGSVKWELGTTKDVIHAFMETLVDPKLPYQCSINETPSQDCQKSIARQMHAVVLLYNYYHRKENPEFEYLDFVSFCKLALSLRPIMTSFMKMIHGSDVVELNGAEDQLSVTEKAMKNACDIAMSLDASKDVPNTEGYPISKVAVLLIDSEKENCLLQRDVVTEGVWSLLEKEIEEFNINQEILADSSVCKKKKTNDQADHSKLLQICFDVVKEVAGIDVSDLVVLEARVVYSLSKEKSAAQFYMVKCKQSFNISQRFSFENLLESLQGPLTEKFNDSWYTRSPVEHYCLLPYLEIISSWLPRKDSCVPFLSDCIAQIVKNKKADEIPKSRMPTSSLAEYSVEVLDYIKNNSSEKKTKTSSSGNVANEDGKNSQKKRKHYSGGKIASSVDNFSSIEKPVHAKDDPKTRCGIHNSDNEGTTRVSSENIDKGGENPLQASLSGHSRQQSQSVVRGDSSSQRINGSVVSKCPSTKEMQTKMNSNMKSKNISCAQHDTNNPEDGVNSMVDTTHILRSNDGRSKNERTTSDNGDMDIFSNQNGTAAAETSLAFEAPHNQVENAVPSEDLQNALALLNTKRQGLYSRLCTMEDTLASYEHIIDLVRDGGEVGFARQCIEYVLSGRDLMLLLKNEVHTSNSQPVKQTKFCNTFLPGKSSCQDLEYTCLKNNWRLPRYFVQALEGKFFSSVVVHCTESVLSSKGGLEGSPLEARESAAAQMIIKIRALVTEERTT